MTAPAKSSFPQDKRLAVTLHFPVEWWSEPSANYQERYHQEYGAKTGAWRLLEVFDRVGVKVTSHMNGIIADLFPDLAKTIVGRGHDVAGHGWDQSRRQFEMGEEDERRLVRRTLARIESVTGYRPRGWVSSGRRSGPNTVRILAEEGLAWHSHHDLGDLPARVRVGDNTIIDCPVQRYMNYSERDFLGFSGDHIKSCGEIYDFFKSQIDALRGAARFEPLCFQFGSHSHMFGLPAYSWVVQQMIEYALSCNDVWFATTDQLAHYWCEAE
jgi:Polysaccharide deacetylase